MCTHRQTCKHIIHLVLETMALEIKTLEIYIYGGFLNNVNWIVHINLHNY